MSQKSSGALTPIAEDPEEEPSSEKHTASGVSVKDLRDIAKGAQRKVSTKRRWRWAVAAVALAAVGVALRLTVLAPKPVPVKVARVVRGVVEQTVTNTRAGTVKARLRARLSPETGGRVVALPYREGSRVKKADVLLRLDDAVQRAQLGLAKEDIRTAAARADEACLAVELAETELQRAIRLNESGVVSQQIVDTRKSERDRARAACRAARARFDQARAGERLARAELDRTILRAPFDGVVAELSTEVGEWITPAPPGVPIPPVMDLIDRSSVYIEAPIDEMDAERVAAGQEVRISVDSRRGEVFKGKVVRVAPYVLDVVEQNRTLSVEAELDDPQAAASLLPGTSADIEVILARRQGVLLIPTAAVAPGNKVLVVAGGRLEERTIHPGLRNWRTTEVKEGLHEAERVVVSRDSPEIQPGARVVIEEEGE